MNKLDGTDCLESLESEEREKEFYAAPAPSQNFADNNLLFCRTYFGPSWVGRGKTCILKRARVASTSSSAMSVRSASSSVSVHQARQYLLPPSSTGLALAVDRRGRERGRERVSEWHDL